MKDFNLKLNNSKHEYFLFQDINDIELKDLQTERCPRISANDLVSLVNEKPDEVIAIDLRTHLEFNRAHLKDSINIPFSSISIADVRLDALSIPDLETKLTNRNVVVVGNVHENAILVSLNTISSIKFKSLDLTPSTFNYSLPIFY